VKVCLLASGSKGNSTFVEINGFRLLVDVGLTLKDLIQRLERIQITPSQLDAIIITHEHYDHVKGLARLVRAYSIPVYLNQGTYHHLSRTLKQAFQPHLITTNEPFEIAREILVHPVQTPHDAADPISVIIQHNGSKIGIATDLGFVTRRVGRHLIGANLIVLESNHDEEMLKSSKYPWSLKQRILSKNGHLSNGAFNNALSKLIHCDLEAVFLAHLSEENNCPDLAHRLAVDTVRKSDHPQIAIHVGQQHAPTPLVEL